MAADESPDTKGFDGPPPPLHATEIPGAGGPRTPSFSYRTTLSDAAARAAGETVPDASGFPWAAAGYELMGELGRGGMGVVYQAHDAKLNRVVAVKVLPGHGRCDPRELVRFSIEAETMAAVSHPNVVAVYDIRECAGQPYIVMEYVNGGSLAALLRRAGPLPAGEAARVTVAVARGVAAAHEQGFIHRDLKPGNVLLHLPARRDPGSGSSPGSAAGPPVSQPKVADFGLARRGLSNDVTHTGALLGTPAYMAPEQATGQNKLVGPAADIYALGVILYECLAGHPPFRGDDHWAVLRQVTDADPPPLRRARPGVPRDLELICGKCLAKDPRDRYPTADAVADDLENYLAGRPVTVRPVSPLAAGRKWARRNPALARMGAVLAAAAVALAGVAIKYAVDSTAAAARDREATQQLAIQQEQGKVLAAERHAADQAAADARRLARSQRFYRQLTVAEVRRFEPSPGWTLDALADAAELAAFPEAAGEATKLRDIAAAALAAPDVQECAPWLLPETGPFTFPSLLAAHPTEPLVAVARFGYAAPDLRLVVWLVNWRTGAVRTLTAPIWLSQIKANEQKESPEFLLFQPDGRRLHVCSRRGNAYSWDLDDPAAPERQEPHLAGDGPVAFRPDGRGFWKAHGKELRACDAAGRVLAARTVKAKLTALSYAAGAHRLVAASSDVVMVLDPDDLTDVGADLTTRTHFTSAAVAPDGRGGVVGVGNEVHAADYALGRLTGLLDGGHEFPRDVVVQPVFSPDGTLVAVPREHSHSVQLFSTRTGRVVATVRTPERTHAPPVAFGPDGTSLFVGGQDRVRVFRLRPGALPGLAVGPAVVSGMALDPTGRALVTHATLHVKAVGDGSTVTASHLAAWNPLLPGSPGHWLRSINRFRGQYVPHPPSFQPDGPWFSFGLDTAGGLWNLATDEERLPARPTDERAVFAPGGKLWRGGTGAAAFGVPGGRQVAAFEDTVERFVGGKTATSVFFTGGDGVLVGTATGVLNWLDPGGKSLGRWKAGDTAPTVAARRPGGEEVVVGHDSGAAGVFRLPGGDPLAAWQPHRGRVTAAVWLGPDDLLTGGADREIHLWRWTGTGLIRLWSVPAAAGVTQMLLLPAGRVAVLEENARGVGVIDVPRFHAELSALVPTEPLRLPPTAAVAELPPLPAALRAEPKAPATGLHAEYFSVFPGTDERVYLAAGVVPDLPSPATVPPHRDLPTEWFAVRYRGFVQAAAPGPHTLSVSTGDKVSVWLDGAAVPGDGEVALALTGRPQRLRVEWTHGQGAARLNLAWKLTPGANPPVLTPDRP